jgi:hypothetical protein
LEDFINIGRIARGCAGFEGTVIAERGAELFTESLPVSRQTRSFLQIESTPLHRFEVSARLLCVSTQEFSREHEDKIIELL